MNAGYYSVTGTVKDVWTTSWKIENLWVMIAGYCRVK